jgi:hypothetical protein
MQYVSRWTNRAIWMENNESIKFDRARDERGEDAIKAKYLIKIN